MNEQRSAAYFSMEIGLEARMPTYSGGLGVLAGDTIRSAADLKVPMVAVTLLYRKGYFSQKLDASGWQTESPVEWAVDDFLEEMPRKTSVTIEGRTVHLRAWKYEVNGIGGFNVPVYFLDSDIPENSEWDRTLTRFLYGGDQHYRLCQEVILGIGGVRMLRALGYESIKRFHMNEGHASLLGLELLFQDSERLKRISSEAGRFQVIYAGKAHPRDLGGKEIIKRIFHAKESLKADIKIAYLENYDMETGKLITSGVDIWLNTPQPPLEASGTSGMKAALNGVPNLSVLDGWWIEGHIEGITGWSIGEAGRGPEASGDWSKDALSLYDKLENVVIPLFYHDRDRFIDVMRSSIALNGSFFNTQRMMLEYVLRAYL